MNNHDTSNAIQKKHNSMLELENFLPYELLVAADEVSQALAKIYGDRYGLSVPEWRVIATLGQYQAMSAKAIGTHSHMNKTMVSRAISSLEKSAIISRSNNNDDLRQTIITLTQKGQDIYSNIVPMANNFIEILTAGIDEEELLIIKQALRHFSRRAKALTR